MRYLRMLGGCQATWLVVLLVLATMLLVVGEASAQASLRLTAPGGTTFTAPSGFDLKLEARSGGNGKTMEVVEFYWLKRNGVRIDFDEALPTRIYSEGELPAGVYNYTLEGRAMYHDPLNGNERYKTIFPIPSLTITVVAGNGGISTSSGTCTIPWGQASCPVTITWNSNAPAARVLMSALDNSGMQVIGQGSLELSQDGSLRRGSGSI